MDLKNPLAKLQLQGILAMATKFAPGLKIGEMTPIAPGDITPSLPGVEAVECTELSATLNGMPYKVIIVAPAKKQMAVAS